MTLATPWTVACQAPMSMGFSRQEYRSGLPSPSPEDLPNPRTECRSPGLQADSLPNELLAPYFMENRGGKGGSQWQISSSWALKSLWMVPVAMKSEDICFSSGKLWKLDGVLKSRDITLWTKFSTVKAVVFPVVTDGCESWTVKKAGHQRIDASKLWCWRRLLRVPWTARRSNQPILREINTDCSLEGLMLKLQYSGHLMWTADTLEKSLMLGKIEGRRRACHRMRWQDGITNTVDMNLGKLRKMVRDRGLVCCLHGVTESWTQVGNWTTTASEMTAFLSAHATLSRGSVTFQQKYPANNTKESSLGPGQFTFCWYLNVRGRG